MSDNLTSLFPCEQVGTTAGYSCDTKAGTSAHALYDEAKKQGWIVISMKGDSKKIFAFE